MFKSLEQEMNDKSKKRLCALILFNVIVVIPSIKIVPFRKTENVLLSQI